MRFIFLFCLLFSLSSFAQEVQIKLLNGKNITSFIFAISDDQVFTRGGTFNYTDIDTLYLTKHESKDLSKIDKLYHALNYSKDSTYRRSLNLTAHEKSMIIYSDTLKKGIYRTFDEFKYNKPSVPLDYKISIIQRKYGQLFELSDMNFYILEIDKKKGKAIGKILGFCDGNDVYINSDNNSIVGQRKLGSNAHFSKIEYLGTYSYFEDRKKMNYSNGPGITNGGAFFQLQRNVISIETGIRSTFDNQSFKDFIRLDEKLLEEFKNELNKKSKIKPYFIRYMDKQKEL